MLSMSNHLEWSVYKMVVIQFIGNRVSVCVVTE